MILSKEEESIILKHRKQRQEAIDRQEKQRKCPHKNTGDFVSGHNSWLGKCFDCGATVEE